MKDFLGFIAGVALIIACIVFGSGFFLTVLCIVLLVCLLCKGFSALVGMLIYGLIGLFIGWFLSLFLEQTLLTLIRAIGFEDIGVCKFCARIGMIYGALKGLLS